MNWTVSAATYHLWKEFSIRQDVDLVFETGNVYKLVGANGVGKTSFIKNVLIPLLQEMPDAQVIYYLEQQVQSQLDAIKAYAALQKTAVILASEKDILGYHLSLFQNLPIKPDRPVFLILDESSYCNNLAVWLETLENDFWCVVYVSHGSNIFDTWPVSKVIKIENCNPALSVIS